jgi:hypothetical protein
MITVMRETIAALAIAITFMVVGWVLLDIRNWRAGADLHERITTLFDAHP